MMIRLLLVGIFATGFALAQEEGGMGGGMGGGMRGGMGGGDMAPALGGYRPSTLDRLAGICKLSDAEKKNLKSTLEAAFKEAEPLRKQIPLNRVRIAEAVQAGKSGADLKPLLDTHGSALADMKLIEMKTFAKVYNSLNDEQKKAGGQQLFNSMNGLFLKKNWNE